MSEIYKQKNHGDDFDNLEIELSFPKGLYCGDFDIEQLAWFADSPDAGHPDCICSYCGGQISDECMVYRIYQDNKEARLCDNCYGVLINGNNSM